MNNTKIALVGIGGYGNVYVNALLNEKKRAGYEIAGVVDPYAQSAPGCAALEAIGVKFYDTLDDFYAQRHADLVVIATPIALHEEQAICAARHGSHILLEKPMSATLESALRIEKAARDAGVKLAIGFQWCYDTAMLALKRDVESGLLGAPKRLRALVLWPRDKAYYARGTGWAGRKYDAKGRPIFDSVASNATAHYIENMLWMAGKGFSGAEIERLEAETYRANAIETFDTITLRAQLEGGAEMLFVATHAVTQEGFQDPMFEYEFERATATFGGYGQKGAALTARFSDGSVKEYGVSENGTDVKIWTMLDAIREGAQIPCPPEAALKHAEVMDSLRASCPDAAILDGIVDTPERASVPGLEQTLIACYENWKLYSEVVR